MKKIKDRFVGLCGLVAVVIIALFTSSCVARPEDGQPYLRNKDDGTVCLYINHENYKDDLVACNEGHESNEEWVSQYFDENGEYIEHFRKR